MPVTARGPMRDLVILGLAGDLAVRKLLPALYRCDRDGRLSDETRVIETSRAGLDVAGYREKIRGEVLRFLDPAAHDGIAASDSLTGSVIFRRCQRRPELAVLRRPVRTQVRRDRPWESYLTSPKFRTG